MENRLSRFRSVAPWHTLAGCVRTCGVKRSSPPRVVVACMCVFGGWECWPRCTGHTPVPVSGPVHAWSPYSACLVPYMLGACRCRVLYGTVASRGSSEVPRCKWNTVCGTWHVCWLYSATSGEPRMPLRPSRQHFKDQAAAPRGFLVPSVKGHMSRLGQAERRYGTQRKERLQGSTIVGFAGV